MSARSLVAACAAVTAAAVSTIGWQRVAAPTPAALAPPAAPASIRAAPSPLAAGEPAATAPLPEAQARATPLDGSWVFRARGCSGCHHGPESKARFGDHFPDLSTASTWAASRRPGLDARQYITESIRQPSAFLVPAYDAPPSSMPTLDLTDDEIAAVVTYLLEH